MNTLKLWGLLAMLLIALGAASWYLSKQQTGADRVRLERPSEQAVKGASQAPQAPKLKKATKTPGRVVELDTTRGKIEFVLFEQDCPKTTSRIADLVNAGLYNGISFPRVEDWVIQTTAAKKDMPRMGIEITDGLTHATGTVGMARTGDPNSNTSVFYITLRPAPHLDSGYTNFGRVIRGMDVATKIKLGDVIKSAKLRPLTDADKRAFDKAMGQ